MIFSNKTQKTKRDLELLLDEPIKHSNDDKLGLGAYPEMLASAIRFNRSSHTFAINAKWGFGKTSVMRQTEAILKKDQNCITPWVVAWHFEDTDKPVVSIVQSMIKEIEIEITSNKDKKKDFTGNFFSEASKILDNFSKIEVNEFRIFGIRFGLPFWDRKLSHTSYQELADNLKKLINLARKNDVQIVVFIDDLDRCNPEKAIKILESIKVIFNQEYFTFVIGIDRSALEHHLIQKYTLDNKGIDPTESVKRAKTYLDKIIQIEFDLPRLKDKFPDFIDSHIPDDKKSNYEVGWLTHGDRILKDYLALTTDYNPRSFKRLVNRLRIEEYLTQKGFGEKQTFKLKREIAKKLGYYGLIEYLNLDIEREEFDKYLKCSQYINGLEEAKNNDIETTILTFLDRKRIPNDPRNRKRISEFLVQRMQTLRVIHLATMSCINPILNEIKIEPSIEELEGDKVPIQFEIIDSYIHGDSLSRTHISKNLEVLFRISFLREELLAGNQVVTLWHEQREILRIMCQIDNLTDPGSSVLVLDKDILERAMRNQLGLKTVKASEEVTQEECSASNLDLADTSFSDLTLLTENLFWLKLIGLSKTQVSDKSNWEILANFHEMTALNIEGNNISILALELILKSNVGSLDSLLRLDISNTLISSIPDGLAKNLKIIHINGASFSNFEFLVSRPSIEEIIIDELSIDRIIDAWVTREGSGGSSPNPELKSVIIQLTQSIRQGGVLKIEEIGRAYGKVFTITDPPLKQSRTTT